MPPPKTGRRAPLGADERSRRDREAKPGGAGTSDRGTNPRSITTATRPITIKPEGHPSPV
jgi:hypothetical protein